MNEKYTEEIYHKIAESIRVKQEFLRIINQSLIYEISDIISICVDAYKNKKKLLLAGNGGSAADAQHIAAELSGRFKYDRDPLYAEALHVNTSFMTAVANDYSYEVVYARMLQAIGSEGDVFFAISTSGNSPNIIEAIKQARKMGMLIVGLTGEDGGQMNGLCDYLIKVPSKDTARIQECHIMIGHIICELVESKLFTMNEK